jgi:hypothetical protein
MNQVKHYSLVNCLHLPYLLRENAEEKYEYSKIACLMASREILRRYNVFRGMKPILSCCRPLDFVALVAALSLALAHLNTHRHRHSYAFLPHQRPSDRALIEQVLETMDRVASVNDDAMTYQSACLLRRLMRIEADAFQGHSYKTEEVQSVGDESPADQCAKNQCNVLHIDIPYFGTIRISRETEAGSESNLPKRASAIANAKASLARSSFSADTTESSATLASPQMLSTTNPGLIDFSLHMGESGMDQLASPGLTATVDDWAFQGVDTAFFGCLMGGHDANWGVSDGGNNDGWTQFT